MTPLAVQALVKVVHVPHSVTPGLPIGVASALMSFLKRLLGSEAPSTAAPIDAAELDAEERQHELDVLRGEQERLDDLAQRQLRYADYVWQPPAQGGERRADDRDNSEG